MNQDENDHADRLEQSSAVPGSQTPGERGSRPSPPPSTTENDTARINASVNVQRPAADESCFPAYEYPKGPGSQRTNSLAIAALILSILFAPVGIVLGHISLSQIKQRHENGRGLATAALAVGYTLTTISVVSTLAIVALFASVTHSVDHAVDSELSTSTTADGLETTDGYPTDSVDPTTSEVAGNTDGYTTTTDNQTTPSDSTTETMSNSSIAAVIRSITLPDCLYKTQSGSTITSIGIVPCGTPKANYEVTGIGSSTGVCTSNWWVTTANDDGSDRVVVCIAPLLN